MKITLRIEVTVTSLTIRAVESYTEVDLLTVIHHREARHSPYFKVLTQSSHPYIDSDYNAVVLSLRLSEILGNT